MTNDIAVRTTMPWSNRWVRCRNIRWIDRPAPPSVSDTPMLDPERRRILMPGGLDPGQPFRNDEGVGAVIERQNRQLLDVDLLDATPQVAPFPAIELEFHPVDQIVHLLIAEARVILAAESIGGSRDLLGVQRRAR